MMKEKYIAPEIEITEIADEDIITASRIVEMPIIPIN